MVKKTKKKPAPKTKSARPAPKKRKAPLKKKASVAKKSGAKKKARAKVVRQPTKKKTVVKKLSKQAPAAKAHKPAKKTSASKAVKPAKQATASRNTRKKAEAKASRVTPEEAASRLAQDQLRQQIVAKARSGAKAQKAVAFTLDDVRGELARTSKSSRDARGSKTADAGVNKQSTPAANKIVEAKIEQKRYGAASLADILGYNPAKNERPVLEESQIDKKFIRYYRLLVDLRDHVNSGLQTHTEETLKRSSREDTGDLSGYGQHMADAGTDTFDRDFALSLVSNEQEALYEIEEAIKRIRNGVYGNCELTGKPITKERLLAVPFARYSVESQAEIEKVQRRSSQRGGVFGDAAGEEGAKLLEDDSD